MTGKNEPSGFDAVPPPSRETTPSGSGRSSRSNDAGASTSSSRRRHRRHGHPDRHLGHLRDHNAGGWPTQGFSQSSGIHDVWNYCIIYPLVAVGLIVAGRAWSVYGHRPISERDIRREMQRQSGRPPRRPPPGRNTKTDPSHADGHGGARPMTDMGIQHHEQASVQERRGRGRDLVSRLHRGLGVLHPLPLGHLLARRPRLLEVAGLAGLRGVPRALAQGLTRAVQPTGVRSAESRQSRARRRRPPPGSPT